MKIAQYLVLIFLTFQFFICLCANFGVFMYGVNWTMSSVVGPQLIIDGKKATLEQVSWIRKP